MANFKNTRLAILLGRVLGLMVAVSVVVAIGLAAACPWACDSIAAGAAKGGAAALRGKRCDAPAVSVAQAGRRAEQARPRWHAAGDKF